MIALTTNFSDFDWDDIRYALAVYRSGTIMGAAKCLGVTHPTVLRRIQRIEKNFKLCFFNRSAGGCVTTEAGVALIQTAKMIEESIHKTHQGFREKTTDLAGILNFTTTETFMDFLVLPILASFHDKYPLISIKSLVGNKLLDIEKREADVALRATLSPPDNLVGIRSARVSFGIYASPKYLEKFSIKNWMSMNWLYPEGSLGQTTAIQWIRGKISDDMIVFRCDSFLALRSMAEAGFGVTLLPNFLGSSDRCNLVCIEKIPDEYSTDLWVLTHPDLRNTAFVKVFMAHLASEIRSLNISKLF